MLTPSPNSGNGRPRRPAAAPQPSIEDHLARSCDRYVEHIDRLRRKVRSRTRAITRVDINVGWASAPGEVP